MKPELEIDPWSHLVLPLENRVRRAVERATESVQDPNEVRLTRELLLSERQ